MALTKGARSLKVNAGRSTINWNPPVLPVRIDSRISWGLAYFLTETDADSYAAWVRQTGATRNGGLFDGMPLGNREPIHNLKTADGAPLFAVSC